jgi:hypothetical protein
VLFWKLFVWWQIKHQIVGNKGWASAAQRGWRLGQQGKVQQEEAQRDGAGLENKTVFILECSSAGLALRPGTSASFRGPI